MLNDNIKKYRKEKGLSQEEMAVRLHVVRQTVSKWENNLSVPDAEVLIRIADLLGVPVSKLLGGETEHTSAGDLTDELARLNELLAQKNRQEMAAQRAGQKRGQILFLSFVSMIIALGVENPVVSILLAGGCIGAAAVILYRNLALLTSVTTDDMKLGILRVTAVFNIVMLIAGIALSIVIAAGIVPVSERGEEMLAMLLIVCVIIFAGIVSPRLPFTKHTGLRLPWTVRDEDTWNVAHKIIGWISLPLTFLYVACTLTVPYFEPVTVTAMVLWLGIPAGVSYIYYRKKMLGK